jgi:hypothetical protein
MRGQARKPPVKGADRRAGRADDDDIVFHGEISLLCCGREGPASLVICGFFDSTAEGARQGGALHKTVARPAKTAYFG